jgi:hypothetical protein
MAGKSEENARVRGSKRIHPAMYGHHQKAGGSAGWRLRKIVSVRCR